MTKIYSHKLKAEEHPVKSVTIFKSSTAEVVRTFTVDLQVHSAFWLHKLLLIIGVP